MNRTSLEEKLNYHYKAFNNKGLISPDPLEIPHKYNLKNDIEIVALISAIFAFGSVKQIIKILNQLENIWGKHPYNFFINYSDDFEADKFTNLKYRFFTRDDIQTLFFMIHHAINKFGSLENLFMKIYDKSHPNLKLEISHFSNYFFDLAKAHGRFSNGIKFMFADPIKGSAAKRMNLFLRWVVRNDELDFGIWKDIRKNQLIIPVDTHVAKIALNLKLTNKKNASWKMAEEITNKLSKFDKEDPVKYDFALCHIGMRKKDF